METPAPRRVPRTQLYLGFAGLALLRNLGVGLHVRRAYEPSKRPGIRTSPPLVTFVPKTRHIDNHAMMSANEDINARLT